MFGRKVFTTKVFATTLGLALLATSGSAVETSVGNTDLNKLHALSKLIAARTADINNIISTETSTRTSFDTDVQNSINTLYDSAQGLGPTLAELPALMDELEQCAADGSCVKANTADAPKFEFRTVTVNGGETGCWFGCVEYTKINTNLPFATWQYCAISGGRSSEDKRHRVYKSGTTWWMDMEKADVDKDWTKGGATATCFRMYK